MLRGFTRLLPLAALASLVSVGSACSSSTSAPSTQGPVTQTVSLTMRLAVPAGAELFKCQFMKMPKVREGESYVIGVSHKYDPGSHHFIVYRTDVKTMEPGMEQQVDCGGAVNDPMAHVRGIFYGAQIPEGRVDFPPGVGLQIAEGEVVLFQSHYINGGKNPIDATVKVDFATTGLEGVKEEAGTMLFYDPFIYVGPHAAASAGMHCPIKSEVKIIQGFSHMHKRGVSYAAWLDPAEGSRTEKPFYTSNDWEHPQTVAGTTLPAGSSLRFQCNYDNTAGDATFIQGNSAVNNEMCAFAGIYWPRQDFDFEFCVSGKAIMHGSQSCSTTLSCLETCPSSESPKFGAGGITIGPCYQKCMSEASPTAGEALYDRATCSRSSCMSECKELASDACKSCMSTHCAKQVSACEATK